MRTGVTTVATAKTPETRTDEETTLEKAVDAIAIATAVINHVEETRATDAELTAAKTEKHGNETTKATPAVTLAHARTIRTDRSPAKTQPTSRNLAGIAAGTPLNLTGCSIPDVEKFES